MANQVGVSTKKTALSIKKVLAAAGLAFSFGLCASAGTAAADGHNIADPDATWGAPDGAEQRGTSMVPAVQSIDKSARIIPSFPATPSVPASPSWPAPPSWGSYPKPPSWPGYGWGIPDN